MLANTQFTEYKWISVNRLLQVAYTCKALQAWRFKYAVKSYSLILLHFTYLKLSAGPLCWLSVWLEVNFLPSQVLLDAQLASQFAAFPYPV